MKLPAKFILILMVTCVAGCSSIDSRITHYPAAKGLPFSEAVQVDDMLYLSGQIGAVPGENKLVPGGIETEARQAMDNIGATLARRGLAFDAVVKCTIMLADMKDWPAFNKVYVSYFRPDALPARSAFGGVKLAFDGRLEIECWAHNPRK
ncbi:MAG: RidA family protein [Sphingorhabdus sp.]